MVIGEHMKPYGKKTHVKYCEGNEINPKRARQRAKLDIKETVRDKPTQQELREEQWDKEAAQASYCHHYKDECDCFVRHAHDCEYYKDKCTCGRTLHE